MAVRFNIIRQQEYAAPATAVQTVTATFPRVPVQNNLLVAVYTCLRTQASMSGPAGWTKAVGCQVSNTCSTQIWYKIAGAGESQAVTCTTTDAAAANRLTIFEVPGVNTSSPLDVVATNTGGTGLTTIASGTTSTTSQANTFAIASVFNNNTSGAFKRATSVWSNGFDPEFMDSVELAQQSTATRVLDTAGVVSTSLSCVGAVTGGGLVAVFKLTAAPSAPAGQFYRRLMKADWSVADNAALTVTTPPFQPSANRIVILGIAMGTQTGSTLDPVVPDSHGGMHWTFLASCAIIDSARRVSLFAASSPDPWPEGTVTINATGTATQQTVFVSAIEVGGAIDLDIQTAIGGTSTGGQSGAGNTEDHVIFSPAPSAGASVVGLELHGVDERVTRDLSPAGYQLIAEGKQGDQGLHTQMQWLNGSDTDMKWSWSSLIHSIAVGAVIEPIPPTTGTIAQTIPSITQAATATYTPPGSPPTPGVSDTSDWPDLLDVFDIKADGDLVTHEETNKQSDAIVKIERSLLGHALASSAGFDPVAEDPISDTSATTGGSPISTAWVAHNAGSPSHSTTFFAHSIRVGALKASWDNNPTLTSDAYGNLAAAQTVGNRTHIAVDYRWNVQSGLLPFAFGDAFVFFASSGADRTGAIETARTPALPEDTNGTVYIPVRSLGSVRCVGLYSYAKVDSVSSTAADLYLSNVRWASQNETDAAMGSTGAGTVIAPASYSPTTPPVVRPLLPEHTIVDLRPNFTIISNLNGVKATRQFRLVIEDGSADTAQQISNIFASLQDGDTLVFPADARFRVDSMPIPIRGLRLVTIDFNGSSFYLTTDRGTTMLDLSDLHDVTLDRPRLFGARTETFTGGTWTPVTGSPTFSGSTAILDAQDEAVRLPDSATSFHARDVDGMVNIGVTLSDTNHVANDCQIEVVTNDTPTTAPSAVATGTEGPMPTGSWYYRYTNINIESRETSMSPPVLFTATTPTSVTLTIPVGTATGSNAVAARRIYRTNVGATDDPRAYRLVDTIRDNTTTAYLDRHTFTSGGTPANSMTPTDAGIAGSVEAGQHYYRQSWVKTDGTETLTGTGGNITLAANGRVTLTLQAGSGPSAGAKHRIYRTAANQQNDAKNFRLVAEVAAVTLSYTDNIADASLGVVQPTQDGPTRGTQNTIIRRVTATATPTAYPLVFPLDDDLMAKPLQVRVRKATATANTITVHSATTYSRAAYSGTNENGHGIDIGSQAGGCSNVEIKNAHVEGISGDGIHFNSPNTHGVKIHGFMSFGCRRQGMAPCQGTDFEIYDGEIWNPGRSGIDFEPFGAGLYLYRASVHDVEFHGMNNFAISMGNWSNLFDLSIYDCKARDTAEALGFLTGGAIGFRLHDIDAPRLDFSIKARNGSVDYIRALSMTEKHNDADVINGRPATGNVAIDAVRLTNAAAFFVEDSDTVVGYITDPNGTLSTPPIKTKTGAAIDADFPHPVDGLQELDETYNRLYVRSNGTWRFTSLT